MTGPRRLSRVAPRVVLVRAAVVLLTGGAVVGGSSPAAADDLAVLVSDDRTVTLTDAEDGKATAEIVLENQGAATPDVTIAPASGAPAGCTITPSPTALEPHQQQTVTLTFAAACDTDPDAAIGFTVTVDDVDSDVDGAGRTFDMQANSPAPSPDWGAVLRAYVIVALAALLVLLAAYGMWSVPAPREERDKRPFMALPGLAASWKFADSWAANATVLTALFAGVFGTKEVVDSLLGEEDATDVLAVALVSAAVSVGLAGLSPMVLQMLRKRFPETPAHVGADRRLLTGPVPADLYVTPVGLLAAAFLTLTATGGQLASILSALSRTDVAEDVVLQAVGVVATLLLGGYAYGATRQNLTTGATLPPPEEEDDASAAAERWRAAAARHLPVQVGDQVMPSEDVDAMLRATAPRRPPRAAPAPGDRPSGIL